MTRGRHAKPRWWQRRSTRADPHPDVPPPHALVVPPLPDTPPLSAADTQPIPRLAKEHAA